MVDDRRLTIHFIDGSNLALSFPPQPGNPLRLAKRIEEAMESNYFATEIDDKLVIVPKTSIKYMEVAPLPDELPETVIRGARSVQSD